MMRMGGKEDCQLSCTRSVRNKSKVGEAKLRRMIMKEERGEEKGERNEKKRMKRRGRSKVKRDPIIEI
jgi:hypothetical protein